MAPRPKAIPVSAGTIARWSGARWSGALCQVRDLVTNAASHGNPRLMRETLREIERLAHEALHTLEDR